MSFTYSHIVAVTCFITRVQADNITNDCSMKTRMVTSTNNAWKVPSPRPDDGVDVTLSMRITRRGYDARLGPYNKQTTCTKFEDNQPIDPCNRVPKFVTGRHENGRSYSVYYHDNDAILRLTIEQQSRCRPTQSHCSPVHQPYICPIYLNIISTFLGNVLGFRNIHLSRS